jgi:hypothetical protein
MAVDQRKQREQWQEALLEAAERVIEKLIPDHHDGAPHRTQCVLCALVRAVRELRRTRYEVYDTGSNFEHWRWAVIHQGPAGEHGGPGAAVCYTVNEEEAKRIADALNAVEAAKT